jgi:hypothetical protein
VQPEDLGLADGGEPFVGRISANIPVAPKPPCSRIRGRPVPWTSWYTQRPFASA